MATEVRVSRCVATTRIEEEGCWVARGDIVDPVDEPASQKERKQRKEARRGESHCDFVSFSTLFLPLGGAQN